MSLAANGTRKRISIPSGESGGFAPNRKPGRRDGDGPFIERAIQIGNPLKKLSNFKFSKITPPSKRQMHQALGWGQELPSLLIAPSLPPESRRFKDLPPAKGSGLCSDSTYPYHAISPVKNLQRLAIPDFENKDPASQEQSDTIRKGQRPISINDCVGAPQHDAGG